MEFLKNENDEKIVTLARTRNPEYFGDLVLRYQQRLFAFIRSIVNNQQTAEDLTQQSFEKAFVALNAFNTERSFKAWLFTIAKNEAFSYLRKQKKQRLLPLAEELTDQDGDTQAQVVTDPAPLADKELIRSEEGQSIRQALKLLKPNYRAVLNLYYQQDMSYQEIAETLDLRLNTVRTHLRRAKAALAKILESETF